MVTKHWCLTVPSTYFTIIQRKCEGQIVSQIHFEMPPSPLVLSLPPSLSLSLSLLDRIDRLQNHAVRIITQSDWKTRSSDILKMFQ